MAIEELRLEASVVDRFSTPLNRLRAALGAVKPPQALLASTRDFERFNAAVTRSTAALQSGFGSALAGVGVQSLAAVGGIAAVSAAIARFAGHALELKEMNRQTGISMRNLQALQGVAAQFGSSSEAVSAGLSKFAQQFYDVQRGVSPLIQDLLNADPSGKLLQHFRNPDRDKALSDILADLGEINKQGARGAETARRLSGMIFGTDDFAKMTADIGRFKRALADAADRAPIVSKEEMERALAFNEAVGKLRNSMSALATTVGTELAPPMTKAIELIDQMIKESRGEIGKGLADSVTAVGNALKQVDWEMIARSLGGVGSATRDIALLFKMMEALSRGDAKGAWDAFNSSSGRVPAQIKAARDEVERRRKTLSDFDKSNPGDARRRWHEENLRASEEKLKKAIEEGARLGIKDGLETMFQRSSFSSGAGGAQIWNASLGGAGGRGLAFGAAGADGGGYGRRSALGVGDSVRGAARRFSGADAGGEAGAPGAEGKYRPIYKLGERDLSDSVVNTIAGEASWKRAGAVDGVINNMLNRVGSKGWGPSRDLMAVARAPGQYAGYRQAGAAEAEFIRSRIKAIASGSVPDNTAGSNAYRAAWYRGPWMRRHGVHGRNVGGNVFAFEPNTPNGPYAPYREPRAVGSAFNASREAGAFGLSGPVARSGEARLSVQITADGKVKSSQVDGGDLFNRVDIDRGRTVSADQ